MEDLPEAVIYGAEAVLLRDDRVLQHQLAGIRRAPAELVFFLRRHHAATLGERRIVAHADPLGLLEIGRVLGHDECGDAPGLDRKSTRLNSSHSQISYAVFCLKKKKPFTLLKPPSTRKHVSSRRYYLPRRSAVPIR